jgi:hypothetical protein
MHGARNKFLQRQWQYRHTAVMGNPGLSQPVLQVFVSFVAGRDRTAAEFVRLPY